ncbi:hypothetical protein T4B_8975 [Trichinella pseudospiralis]|uniref:Uncharacterized protein n=1 Tax=Trichinella pseudospiralis TaxID=6337 RepID=A0A0V1HWQ1_TRIPS|nr:hypothetical protein T4B_8975 [Trichinella pseudospiralis]
MEKLVKQNSQASRNNCRIRRTFQSHLCMTMNFIVNKTDRMVIFEFSNLKFRHAEYLKYA